MTPAETPRLRNYLLAAAFLATVAAMVFVARHRQAHQETRLGYEAWTVLDAQQQNGSYAVHLIDGAREKTLVMYVGQSEGLTILYRLQGMRYERPLSMDLMDTALTSLGAEVERVQIDSIRDLAYIGSLHLKQGGREITLDARPSDAVALALAHHLPVFVAEPVIAVAAVPSRR
jgi:hypothetical protein